jgi:hypothetical protein
MRLEIGAGAQGATIEAKGATGSADESVTPSAHAWRRKVLAILRGESSVVRVRESIIGPWRTSLSAAVAAGVVAGTRSGVPAGAVSGHRVPALNITPHARRMFPPFGS